MGFLFFILFNSNCPLLKWFNLLIRNRFFFLKKFPLATRFEPFFGGKKLLWENIWNFLGKKSIFGKKFQKFSQFGWRLLFRGPPYNRGGELLIFLDNFTAKKEGKII